MLETRQGDTKNAKVQIFSSDIVCNLSDFILIFVQCSRIANASNNNATGSLFFICACTVARP